MIKKTLWLMAAGLMVLSLVMTACSTTTSTTSTTTTTAKTTTTTTTASTAITSTTTTQPAAEAPKYGGTWTETTTTDPIGFDPLVIPTNSDPTLQFTHDTLLSGDWTRGPSGTGETDWTAGIIGRTDLWSGQLAQSWEIPDAQTITYHILPGVHWMNKPPVNGRELTAADVAWCLNTEWWTPGTNWDIFFKPSDRMISANATDKYTLVCKVPPAALGTCFLELSERCFVRAPEVTTTYGNQNNWRNQNTTGPFYIKDYVPGSIIIYNKNPSYWEKDPVGPGKGNQLPYIDVVQQLIVPDASTRLAAFRIGKLDIIKSLAWEDAVGLMNANPALMSKQVFGSPLIPCGRVDIPGSPFQDVRVRVALNMAVNKQQIVDQYYGGHAVLYGYPFPPGPTYSAFYTPFNQLPAAAQQVFTYDPGKAKQLLTDAGYPNGFKTTILVANSGTNVDYLAMVKDSFSKVGVDLTIQPMDTVAFTNVSNNKNYKEMIARGSTMSSMPYMLHDGRIDSASDASNWQDTQSLAVYQTIQNTLGRDDSKWVQAVKDFTPDLLEQAWGVFMPVNYVYHLWWPWVKNYQAEVSTGYSRFNRYVRYAWIDQDLKKTMGH